MDVQNNMQVPTLLQFVHAEQTLSHCLMLLFLSIVCMVLRRYKEL
jgi:hypothetical protein